MTGFLETIHTAEAEADLGGDFLALELSAEYILHMTERKRKICNTSPARLRYV